MNKKIDCEVCGKRLEHFGYLVSSYAFCSKDCLKKFRYRRLKNGN